MTGDYWIARVIARVFGVAQDTERAAIVAWLRQCGSDHEQDGRLSRVAIGKTFAKVADAIERGEHLDAREAQ